MIPMFRSRRVEQASSKYTRADFVNGMFLLRMFGGADFGNTCSARLLLREIKRLQMLAHRVISMYQYKSRRRANGKNRCICPSEIVFMLKVN